MTTASPQGAVISDIPVQESAPQPGGLKADRACTSALQARAHHSPELLFARYLACKSKSLWYLQEESQKACISG